MRAYYYTYLFVITDTLNPLISQNQDNIAKVKVEIEDVFNKFVEGLNEQKQTLFKKLDEIESEKYAILF